MPAFWSPVGQWISRFTTPKSEDRDGKSVEVAALTAPQLMPEQDVSLLVDDMRKDYQAYFAMETLKANVARVPVSITLPDGQEDERARLVASKLSRLWSSSLQDILKALEYGRAAFQKQWVNDSEAGTTDLKLHFLPVRFQNERFTHLELDDQGRFLGIKLTCGSNTPAMLPAEDAWWAAIGTNLVEPYGRSLYLGAPQEVRLERKEAFRLRKIFLKRFALRGGIVYAQPTVQDEATGKIVDNFMIVAQKVKELYSGGTLVLPSTRDVAGNLKNEFKEPPSSLDPTPLDGVIDGLDSEMSRALLVHEDLTGSGSGGSDSSAMKSMVQHTYLLLANVERILDQLVRSFQSYVVEKVEARNTSTPWKLTTTYTPLTKGEDPLLLQVVAGWLSNNTLSPIIKSGAIDIVAAMDATGIPLNPAAREKIEAMIGEAKQAEEEARKLAAMAPQVEDDKAGASGFRNPAAGQRPAEQGGKGGDPEDPESKAPDSKKKAGLSE